MKYISNVGWQQIERVVRATLRVNAVLSVIGRWWAFMDGGTKPSLWLPQGLRG